MSTKKKEPGPGPVDVPMQHVMAFNAVSAMCHVGVAIGLRIDGSLDDEPDTDVIIMAKDEAALLKFHQSIGRSSDMAKVKAVALADRASVRVIPARDLQYSSIAPSVTNDDL